MYSEFECIKCGECCSAGYEINVQKADIEQWMNLGKTKILKHLMINPKCISMNTILISELKDGNILAKKKKHDCNTDLDVLNEFILKNHSYYYQNSLQSNVESISHIFRQDPFLIPINFKIMLEGIILGLDYLIGCVPSGICSFLKLNECMINDVKPRSCKNFPFTKDKCLRKDYLYSSISKGIKSVE